MARTGSRTWPLLSGLMLLMPGCGENAGAVAVKGTVLYEGQPLPKASVTFLAQDPEGRDARGSTDANGVFRLSTVDANDGALPGKYKVTVQVPQEFDSPVPAATPQEAQEAMTGLKPKASIVIPPQYSQSDQTILVQEVPATGEVIFDLKKNP